MKKTLLIAALLGVVAISSCKKDTAQQPDTTTTAGINSVEAPTGFNWASTRSLNVSATITDTRFGATAIHRIAIYDGDPFNGGRLLAAGSATTANPFTTKITIPTALGTLYVVKTSADNSQIIQKVTPGPADIALTFGSIDPSITAEKAAAGKLQVMGGTPASPDCNSGCSTTITTSTSNVNVNSGNVICITGNNITVSFASVNGGTVRVCGSNVTLQNYNFQNGSNVYVTTNGSVNLSGVNFNSSSSTLSNWGTVNYSGSFPDNGIINNYGTMNVSGDFNINSNAGALTNNGTMNIAGSFNNGSSASATNNGSMIVSGNFQQNGGAGVFVNNCSLNIGGDYNQSSAVKNYSYIKVTSKTTINSSTTLNLYNGAMFSTQHFLLDGSTIAGNGSTSLLLITTGDAKVQNSGAIITGPISVCVKGNFSTAYMSNGAALDCDLYIPVSGCNPDGNGTATVKDTDGDGVPDNLDAFPNDATKAYISSGGTGTVAFEDQWPNKGDFDLNDLVMSYSYTVITNAANVVVQVTGKYSLLATGGNYGNGFGVEFPTARANVSGLTRGTLEAGQTKAVVTLFSNMRTVMANWNTQPGVAQSPVVKDSITFNVANGPTLASFGQDGYNPFIWNMGGDNKRHEVHLWGKTPTTLADQSLFGTGADNTNVAAGRYYVTTTGLPYAISIPATFSYPIEGTDITSVYLHFADWAQSGGTSYTDWYSNTATGYRNTSLIYTH
ncbi:LruC domain-containing protein [Mucilaginibacter sp. PPCGB 2223]|uniref:LruC domain-containing protein n=1 Tax=Mucilaginibacter sp. PPCGB 2223 TaxID=1886027 RepID=UPI001586F771|nr:LruC domain-containing protein [Mucilaginibacter sp. PPCGB 2223]